MECSILIDSGADRSIISLDFYNSIPRESLRSTNTLTAGKLSGVSGYNLEVMGEAQLEFKIGEQKFTHKFSIVKGVIRPALLGSDFLRTFGATLDYKNYTLTIGGFVVLCKQKGEIAQSRALIQTVDTVTIPPQSIMTIDVRANIPGYTGDYILIPYENAPVLKDQPGLLLPNMLVSNNSLLMSVINTTGREYTFRRGRVVGIAEGVDVVGEVAFVSTEDPPKPECPESEVLHVSNTSDLTERQQAEFQDLLNKHNTLFAKTDRELGRTDLVEMEIDTGDHPPIHQRPYRSPLSQRTVIEQHVNDMLSADVIKSSSSPWASPLVTVPKKDGTTRFCVDYRKLNNVSVRNAYPLPNIDDIFTHLGNAKFYSCLDLKSGYWQIRMADKDKAKTAFTSHLGLFEFNVMPFGLTNAPSVFQELMNKVLSGVRNRYAIAYLDDVIVFSETFDDHLEHLRDVFQRLENAGLKLKRSKCDFFKRKVHYLGHIISAQGIEPDPEKIAVIKGLQPPKTVRDVRAFIGMANFYRKFIPNFAEIAKPMTNLTRHNARFFWGPEEQGAFDVLKEKLTQAPVLAYADPALSYKLYTDASEQAVGAVLTQVTPEGERVIQYISHKLKDGPRKWPVIEREAFAIVYAIAKLRHFLLGSRFTVYTDHKPLRTLFTSEMRNTRVQKWAVLINEYGCNIEYFPGKKNVCADMMSRAPQGSWSNGELNSSEIDVIDSDDILDFTYDNEDGSGDTQTPADDPVSLLKGSGIHDLQRNDGQYSLIIEGLEKGLQHDSFVLDEGNLYHLSSPVRNDPEPRMQLVVPTDLVHVVLEAFHDNNGHMGIDKTYSKIRFRYFWYNMYRDVVEHIQKCEPCVMRKSHKKATPMQDMPIPNYPFEIVGIDTCGPYSLTNGENRYLVTIIDHFSGWPEAFPVKDKSAMSIAGVLCKEFLPRHSCPRIILSDQGTEYCNEVINVLSREMNIHRVRTAPYHPQTNGKTERFHRAMNDMLAKTVRPDHSDWDECIAAALMAYRTSVNDTTRFTPFFLVYGRDPILPLDTLLRPKFKYMGEDYIPTMLQRLHIAYTHSKENTLEARERNKAYIARNAASQEYNVGDAVYYRDKTYVPGTTSKFKSPWKPFYRVIEITSPVNVRIKNQLTGTTKLVNVGDVKLAHPEANWDTNRPEPQYICSKGSVARPTEQPERVQPVRQARLTLHNEKSSKESDDSQSPTGETQLSGGQCGSRITINDDSAELLSPSLLADAGSDDNPQAPDLSVSEGDAPTSSDGTSVERHGYNLRPRPQLGPPYLEQHPSRVPKRKLLETSVTLPTAKVHRRDDSEQMDCDEVSSLSNCSGAHDNCGRPTKSWYEAVISYVVDLMLE